MFRYVLLMAWVAVAAPAWAQVVLPKKPNALESPLPLDPEPTPAEVIPVPVVTETIAIPVDSATPKFWFRVEYVANLTKQSPLIPLVTANQTGIPASLGSPGTSLLIGPGDMPQRAIDGLRGTFGFAVPRVSGLGIEMSYFYLDNSRQNETDKTRNYPSESTNNTDLFAAPYLGIPVVNPNNGEETALGLRSPFRGGAMFIETSTKVQGAEAMAVWNFVDNGSEVARNFRLYGLAGYRFLMLNESLRVEADPFLTSAGPNPSTFAAHTVDRVETSNQFHGGLVGLRMYASRGPVFFELDGKLSIGGVHQTLNRSGMTAGTLTSGNASANVYLPYGLYVNPQNSGRFIRDVAVVLPEGGFRIGLGKDKARLFVGYNLLYLGDVLRPGDQLDRTIDPASFASGTPAAIQQAAPRYGKSDFWMQGLTVGMEFRY